MNQDQVMEILYSEFLEQNARQEERYRWDSIKREDAFFHLKRGDENMSVDGFRLLSRLSELVGVSEVVSESLQVLNETQKYASDDFSVNNIEKNKELYHVILRKSTDVFYQVEDKSTTFAHRKTPFFGVFLVPVLDSENAFAFIGREHLSGEEEERLIFETAMQNMEKKIKALDELEKVSFSKNGGVYQTYVLEDDTGFAATQALFFDYDSLKTQFKRVGVAIPRRDLFILFDATYKKSALRMIQQTVRREYNSRYSISDSLYERQDDGTFTKLLVN